MNGSHQPNKERSFLSVSGRRLLLPGINYYFFPHCLLARIIEASQCTTSTTKPLFFTTLTFLIFDIAFVFLAYSVAIQPRAQSDLPRFHMAVCINQAFCSVFWCFDFWGLEDPTQGWLIPCLTEPHQCCIFYELKTRRSTSKKIMICFVVIPPLLRWSGTKPKITLRYAYSLWSLP